MISKLKTECGCQFTSKLEGMFKDMQISTTIMDQYRNHCSGGEQGTEIELSVHVLTTGCWPTQSAPQTCQLPPQMRQGFERFKKLPSLPLPSLPVPPFISRSLRFYLGKHSGRKLTLNPNVGQVDLNALFYPAGSGKAGSRVGGVGVGGEDSVSEDAPGPSAAHPAPKADTRKHILQVSVYQSVVLLLFNAKNRYSFQVRAPPSPL